MDLDDTYSISEAVLVLEKRQRMRQRGPQPAGATGLMDDGPIDVVAVVSGVATINSTLSMNNATPRVDLRIIDPSIPPNFVAKVSLQGSMEVARITEEQISPGDILRFNRLRLGRHHHPQDSNDIKNHDHIVASSTATMDAGARGAAGSNTTLLHFEVSFDDPEPGFRWCKLGRIRITTTQGDDDFPHHGFGDRRNDAVFPAGAPDNHRSHPRAIFSDDRRGATNFPQEMVTSDSRIGELLAWYDTRGLTARTGSTGSNSSVAPVSFGDRRNRPFSMAMTSVAGDQNVRSLSPLPCKRRSLAEIQVSSGLLSNLVVRITHYDLQVIPLQSTTTSFVSSRPSPKPVRQSQVIGFASVTDSSGVVMSFVDAGERFGSYLRAGAEDPTKVIMMTNVMSKKQSEIFGRPLVSEEVVLWPTKHTNVSILDHGLSDERRSNESIDPTMAAIGAGGSSSSWSGDDPGRHRALPQSRWRSPVTATASLDRSTKTRRVGDETIAVKFGVVEFETDQPTQVMTSLDHLRSMKSSIDDILVNGLSLQHCLMDWSPGDLQANLLTSDGLEYNSVTIQLAMKSRKRNTISQDDVLPHKHDGRTMVSLQDHEESSSGAFSSYLLVQAGSSVVQALCGGIAPTEWKVDRRGEHAQPQNLDDNEQKNARVGSKNDPEGDDEPPRRMPTGDGGLASLGWNVLRLLSALLHEEVELTWTIDVRHDPPLVENVFLSSF